MNQAFTTQIDQGIAELVIDKPPVNALDSQQWRALAAQINTLGANPEVRVIVIRAEGRGFVPGSTSRNWTPTPSASSRSTPATMKPSRRCTATRCR